MAKVALCAEPTTKDGGSRNSYSRRDRNRWNRHVVERCPCVGRRYGAGRRAKMSKRQAGVQITKDDYNDDRFPDEEEPVGTWQKASEEVLAQRKIRKAKRPPPRTAEEIQKFGVAAEPSSAAAGPAACDATHSPTFHSWRQQQRPCRLLQLERSASVLHPLQAPVSNPLHPPPRTPTRS